MLATRPEGSIRILAAAILVFHLAGIGDARSQIRSAPAGQQALFDQMLRDPGNVELAVRYAELTARAGDVEAAIGALERVLFFNPDLARVRVELGILYYRLGSYEMAQGYFSSALAVPGAPADVRGRAEQFMAASARRLQPHQWSGFVQTGLRYQTNANYGPSAGDARIEDPLNGTVLVDPRFLEREDWNWFVTGGLGFVYDFGNQRGDALEIDAIGYHSRQFELTSLDVGLLEVSAGPRFGFPTETLSASVKPYVLANASSLGDELYLATVGGGLSARVANGAAFAEPFLEYRRRDYRDLDTFPTSADLGYGAPVAVPESEDLSGDLVRMGVRAAATLGPGIGWFGQLAFEHNDAERVFYGYDRLRAEVGLPVEVHPLWDGRRKAVLTPLLGVRHTGYREPNPFVDPEVERRDVEYRVGAVLDAAISDWLGIGIQVLYRETDSNLDIFDTDNLSVSFGPIARF